MLTRRSSWLILEVSGVSSRSIPWFLAQGGFWSPQCLFQRRYPNGYYSMCSVILNVLCFTRAKRVALSMVQTKLILFFFFERAVHTR